MTPKYYEENREKILAYAKSKREEIKNDPEKAEKKKEYHREYYRRRKEAMTQDEIETAKEKNRENSRKRQTKSAKRKEWLKPYSEKYKGFKFEFDGDILTVEVKLPFRIMMVDKYGIKHCDDKKYNILQNTLRRRLFEVEKAKTLTIIECGYLQFFTTNPANIDVCCEVIRSFINEQYEIYGQYEKRGYTVGKDFIDGNQ